ncbi:MAG: DUF1684 domain-containing protein [Cryomorphaceae bacterium]
MLITCSHIRYAIVLILAMAAYDLLAQDRPADYEKLIVQGRKAKDKELKSKRHSPLQAEDRKAFHGLNYFAVDPEWRKLAHFILLENGDTLDIMTSAGKTKEYFEYGLLVIEHLGDADSLTAYKRIWPEGYESPYAPYLFVPFTDLSTGKTTYGGGRYLDIDVPLENGDVVLDFNLCYNPYCAYGSGFSCPIPPKQNFLDVHVEAGEKDFGKH